ncbi:MAG: tRNA threonylcarbamoyladenosine dehydratase [Clostridia bacterium]|nr:tRNA threonylcarbamoyladenosine dehydratase [Clostridia bacterium]
MNEFFSRTEALLGKDALSKLQKSRVALFGLGGVGGFALEGLVRSGVGHIDIFDFDTISPSNINRQIIATSKNIGEKKTEAAKLRAKEISPDTEITVHDMFYLPENADSVDLSSVGVIIDAVDTVTAKLEIISRAKKANLPVISCMGTGNKTDITRLEVGDLFSTRGCPLARVMRKELRARGIDSLKVVWSDEEPNFSEDTGDLKGNRPAPASAIFVPAAAGLLLAKEAISILLAEDNNG